MGVGKKKLLKQTAEGHLFLPGDQVPASLWRARHSFGTAFVIKPSLQAAMLSRALLRAGVTRLSVRPVSTTAVKSTAGPWIDGVDIFENEKNPERDHANFPRRCVKELPDPVRHWWIPEEYFQFFHSKTGVTGPYMFAISLGTYMSSKEVFVYEHDFYCGLAFWAAMITLVNVAGPGVTKSLDTEIDSNKAELDSIRQREIDRCAQAVEDEEKSQWMASSYEELISKEGERISSARGRVQGQDQGCIHSGEASPGLPAADRQRFASQRAETHGQLDHRERQEEHHRQAGGGCSQEVCR